MEKYFEKAIEMVVGALEKKNGRQHIVREVKEVEMEGSNEWIGKFEGVVFILECDKYNIESSPKLKSQYLMVVSYRSKELLPINVYTAYYEYNEVGRDVVWDISFRKDEENNSVFLKFKFLSSSPEGFSEKEIKVF